MKTDIRTKYTKKVIRECFFDLLKENPLNRITVKAICEKADINRTTFYRYYKDPFDLMEQIENEMLDAFRNHAKVMMPVDMESALETMFSAVIHNQEMYLVLISDNADRSFVRKMILETYDLFKESLAKTFPSLSDNQRRWMYYYIAQGSVSVTIDWLHRGMKETPAEMASFIAEMNLAVLEHKFTAW